VIVLLQPYYGDRITAGVNTWCPNQVLEAKFRQLKDHAGQPQLRLIGPDMEEICQKAPLHLGSIARATNWECMMTGCGANIKPRIGALKFVEHLAGPYTSSSSPLLTERQQASPEHHDDDIPQHEQFDANPSPATHQTVTASPQQIDYPPSHSDARVPEIAHASTQTQLDDLDYWTLYDLWEMEMQHTASLEYVIEQAFDRVTMPVYTPDQYVQKWASHEIQRRRAAASGGSSEVYEPSDHSTDTESSDDDMANTTATKVCVEQDTSTSNSPGTSSINTTSRHGEQKLTELGSKVNPAGKECMYKDTAARDGKTCWSLTGTPAWGKNSAKCGQVRPWYKRSANESMCHPCKDRLLVEKKKEARKKRKAAALETVAE
jgi:hypothetical protein